MIFKERRKSHELLLFEALSVRSNLSLQDKQYFKGLEKGYQGELLFDSWTEELSCDCLILNDVLLKQKNNHFQNDTLMLLAEKLFLFEIKNFEGDHYYDSERLYLKSKEERSNPLLQLERNESLLRQLLQASDILLPIYSYVVFVNSAFTMYQAPLNKPFIYPTQIKKFLQQFDQVKSTITPKEKYLAKHVTSLHIEKPPMSQVPDYHFDQLKKGIFCPRCKSFQLLIDGRKCFCQKCNQVEFVEQAVLRCVREYRLLFPERKITTNDVYEWCNRTIQKQRVQRILNKNFKQYYLGRVTYYEV
ncbi:NERD domain-containing protein [Gracilibacillus oryzae]|uniref:NERD domain-containing protein n=1 Tax=Gracilibacillus oryzae TaxID=1672701 RepID=A0A7C8GUH8_9BACI|nr:nuclease-related domain-containing protein [Gracilibacillus oryzae]KAB8137642.1 NERD domain-containing protein [Gracilibacillus oryzae]